MPDYSWSNLESGRYQVRGFYQDENNKESQFSEVYLIPGEDINNLWINLPLNSLAIPNLPFFPSPFPHQDILFATSKKELQDLNFPGFYCSNIHGFNSTKIFANYINKEKYNIFFSGSAFYEDELVFGQEEAENSANYLDLIDSIGDFFATLIKENQIILTNDYFGVQKIYYFQGDDVFLASNRVHLLLLGMINAKIDLQIDPTVVRAILASGYVQASQQIFTQNLMVKGVKMLPIDTRICIKNGTIDFEPKLISDLLCEKVSPVREMEYEDILEKGINDVIRQSAAVINHPRFKNIIFDATGGMDSRVILAAAAKCDKAKNRVTINAMDTPSIPLDIRVACHVASNLGFQHDKSPEVIRIYDKDHHKLQAISQLLGTYFAYDLNKRNGESVLRNDSINVTGFFGEICLRPYYSRNYLNQKESTNATTASENFYDFLIQENRSALTNSLAKSEYKKLWIDSIKSLPGGSAEEKYDLHYLFYRNGLHCSDIFRMKWDTPRIGVIQSKNLFILKRKLFNRSPKTLLQNEVIFRISPEALTVPYASPKDNADLIEASVLKNNKSILEAINKIDYFLFSGDEARDARRSKKVTKEFLNSSNSIDIDLLKLSERAIFELSYEAGVISPEFGKELLIGIKSSASPWVLINKVLMTYYTWILTKMPSSEAQEMLRKTSRSH